MKQINFSLIFRFSLIVILLINQNSFAQDHQECEVIPNVIYGYKYGMALTMDVYIPLVPNGAAVIFINSGGFISPAFYRQCINENGNSWETGSHSWKLLPKDKIRPKTQQQLNFQEILDKGFTVFDVRHGSAPKYMLDEIVSDINEAIKFIKDNAHVYKASNDRLGIWGLSAGGYLSAFATVNPIKGNSLKAAVLFYPAGYDFFQPQNDTVRLVLPSLHIDDRLVDSLSLKHYIKKDLPPILIMYGELDRGFITIDSDEFYQSLKEKNNTCDKIIFENVGHLWLNSNGNYDNEVGDKAMKNLIDWFLEYL
jgi:dienelactone hydrolase